jgi:hypothetical protein
MLMDMTGARTWEEVERLLPAGWSEARLAIRVDDPPQLGRAAAILGPLNPGRSGEALILELVNGGGTNGPEAVKRALARLIAERIFHTVELLGTTLAEKVAPETPDSLAASWDAALATLPSDWSDVYGEIALESSDHLDRAALLLSPINPYRVPGKNAFRFRCARLAGYGASAGMVRRCLERVDANGMTGTVTILRVLCETRPVATQGPQWVEGGKHF